MNHFERRLWRWAWRMRVRMDRRRGDLLPAPFSPRPQDADTQTHYASSILAGAGNPNHDSASTAEVAAGSAAQGESTWFRRRKWPDSPNAYKLYPGRLQE